MHHEQFFNLNETVSFRNMKQFSESTLHKTSARIKNSRMWAELNAN